MLYHLYVYAFIRILEIKVFQKYTRNQPFKYNIKLKRAYALHITVLEVLGVSYMFMQNHACLLVYVRVHTIRVANK